MGAHCLNFARPPALSSISLPNNRNTRNPAAAHPPALTSAREPNVGAFVVLSQGGRSSTPKFALKWLKKLPPGQSPRLSSPLVSKHNYGLGPSAARSRDVFSKQHLNERNRYTLSKAAQKLAKSSGHHPNRPKKHDDRLLGSIDPPYDDGRQLLSGSEKASTGCHKLQPDAHGKRKRQGSGKIMSFKGDDGGDGENLDSGTQAQRAPQARSAGLWSFCSHLAGFVSLSSAALAAQASVKYGGGNGLQPPSGSGGGGGGGENGGFEAGSNGESFFGDLIYGPGRKRDDKSSPRAPIRRRIPDNNRLPARTLASLSSAAGDLMDGEAPIGGGRERGRMFRGSDEPRQHIPNKQGSYSSAQSPFSDGMREPPRDSMTGTYDPADPFFSGGDGRGKGRPSNSASSPFESSGSNDNVQDMNRGRDASFSSMMGGRNRQDPPSNSPTSSFDGSGSNDNVQDMNRGRDASFSPMIGGRNSTGYNSSTNHFSSAKQQPQPQQYHNQKNYAEGDDLRDNHKNYAKDNDLRGADSYYSQAITTRRGDSLHVPSEFSSIRGKISEIPGYVQEGGEQGQKLNDGHRQGPVFPRWLEGLGGLVSSIVGKRTGGETGLGIAGQSGNDVDKRELVTEVANRTLHMIKDKTTENGLAKSSETGALRRMQRETFSDLLKIRERLDKLEDHTGARRGKHSGDALGGVKTSLKGEVNAGGAYVLVDDLTTNLSRLALQHAGLMTGLDVRFTFETPMRENDLLTTQCGVGQAFDEDLDSSSLGGPVSLQKINYVAQINEALSVAVAPLGAKASDIVDTVNHLQGQALTTFAGSGPTMYQHCRGSAIGASLRSNSVMLSMSQFLSGWGSRALDSIISGPLCLSTMAQIMVQPCEHMVFSMSAVNNLWPCPPLPSSSGFHWSEMGPLVLCKTISRPTQPTGTFMFNDLLPTSSTASFLSQVHVPERDRWNPDAESTLGSSGTSTQSVALSGEVDLGGHVSIGGWAQFERADWLEELERKDFQWNVSLAKASGTNFHWGLSLGRRKRDDWSEDGSASPTSGPLDPSSPQLQMEAFVKLKVGRGFSLQPGLVYIVDKNTQTPAFMLRSSWSL